MFAEFLVGRPVNSATPAIIGSRTASWSGPHAGEGNRNHDSLAATYAKLTTKELRQAECGLARSFKRSILIAAIAVTFLGLEVNQLVFDVG